MARHEEGWTLDRDPRTGVYTVRFRLGGRRTHRSTRTRDRGEALERARAIYQKAVSGPAPGERSGASLAGTPVKTLCAAWIRAMEITNEVSEPTRETWMLYARTHWGPFFADAAELASERRLAAYVAHRLKSAKGATVAKECSALQSLLRWCARPDVAYLASAPTVPRPDPSAGKAALTKVRVDLTPEQIEAIIAALPVEVRAKERGGPKRPMRALFRVLWETGLRIGTLTRLEAPHDYRRGAAELVIRDEADKARFGRTLDLTPAARAALDEVCPERGPIFEPINFRTQLRRAALAAGVPEHLAGHVSPHDFRHARTTALLDAGAPLTGVAYVVGHKQITTTNLYTHARRSEGKRALAVAHSGHRPGHRDEEPRLTAGDGNEKAPGLPGLTSMGHGGLEPPANGLRVQASTPLRGVLLGFSRHRDAPEGARTRLSGHGVPAAPTIGDVAAALEAALIARRKGSPFAWDRVLDAAELVADLLEAKGASVSPSAGSESSSA